MTITVAPPMVPDLLGTSPADLVEPTLHHSTSDDARERADRIRAGLASYSQMRQDIADAYARRDWIALEYPTWAAYVEGEFGAELRALSRDERREAVADLRSQGASIRQIAGAVGAPKSVVADDLQVSGSRTPAVVTGADGKTYPATRPEPPARQDPDPTSPGPAVAATGGPDPDRPKPPKWDPAERKAHEQEVLKQQDIRMAKQQATTLVPDVRALIFTVLQGSRQDKAALKGLITRDMIADLRRAIDLLEGEIDDEQ